MPSPTETPTVSTTTVSLISGMAGHTTVPASTSSDHDPRPSTTGYTERRTPAAFGPNPPRRRTRSGIHTNDATAASASSAIEATAILAMSAKDNPSQKSIVRWV